MSQSKKGERRDKRSRGKTPLKTIESAQGGRWLGLAIALVFSSVIVITLGAFYYLESVVPFRRTVITVDDTPIRMDYFLKRTQLAGATAINMLEPLTNELIIKKMAPQYGIEVTSEDINQELRQIARGQNESITESEFKEWYRQQLNESRLSDAEYKEIIRVNLFANGLQQYLATKIPNVAEQLHLKAIVLNNYEEAEKVRARWEAGADFSALAREVSIDKNSAETGGDLGWVPQGVMLPVLDYAAFNLKAGEVSQPVPYTTGDQASSSVMWYLLFVTERAEAKELDEASLKILQSRALEDWLGKEIEFHEVKYHGLRNGFDSYTVAWINFQLAKNAPSGTQQ